MARQTLPKVIACGNFPATLPITANAADLVMTAADATNKEEFVSSGREIVIAHNTGVSTRTVTVTSVADGFSKRTGDISAYSLGAGEYAVFGPFERQGWMQSDGKIYLEASHADVKFGIVTIS